ncbi:MAG: hypothetical protein MUC31_07775 [Bacteroidales bacterium]|nr:hypothetical protein [Bacteroidales bacterium]
MLKRDNIAFGVLLGFVLPGLFYGLLSLIAMFVETGSAWARPFEPDRMMILALVINVIPIRLYFVTYKFDRSGRGVLLATFLIMVVYFIFIRYF